LINKDPEYIIRGKRTMRKILSYQQCQKAKIKPKLPVKTAVIKRETFSPMAF